MKFKYKKKNLKEEFKTLEGFEKIYRLYFKKVFGICFSKTQDERLAQDMAQDIFLSLWKRKEDLVLKAPIEHYLVRCAKLEVMSYYRTKANRSGKILQIPKIYGVDNTTENQVIYNELEDTINMTVDNLPEKSKKVFRLSREEGMTNKEIAKNLNISEKGVEYHISKSLSFLRKNIESYS